MPELALALYLIGFAATATSPLDDGRLLDKPVWVSLAVGAAWPPFAVMIVAGRLWRMVRGG